MDSPARKNTSKQCGIYFTAKHLIANFAQHLERRAIAHQNKPLIRAVLRIWLTQTRQKRCEALRDQRLKAKALRLWVERVQANRVKENLAVQFSSRVDKHLASRYLSIWTDRLARRRKLERRAQRAFEATVKAKALIQWRSVMCDHAKQVKQAKLVRRLFLTRLAWKRWRDVVEARRWEQSRVKMERKVLKRALDAWKERARMQKSLRRKGEVVRMAAESVSDAWQGGVKLRAYLDYSALGQRGVTGLDTTGRLPERSRV
jgi:protein SFI1